MAVFFLCAGVGGLYALMDGKTVRQALLVGISAGFFLPMVIGAALLLGLYAVDIVACLIAGTVLFVWLLVDWRHRKEIVAKVHETEERWAKAVANDIACAARWLVGRNR